MKIAVYQWGYKKTGEVEFRFDPIPGTRGGRRCYCWWRRMKTTQEIRMNQDVEHKLYTRGKRRNLPEHWDDVHRCVQRSWKTQNKNRNQYKKLIDM